MIAALLGAVPSRPAATANVRTAVVVLGYHPCGHDWERVVWGDARAGLLGRVPQGVLVAASMRAELLVLGDGRVLKRTSVPKSAFGEKDVLQAHDGLARPDPVAMLTLRLAELGGFGGALARLPEERLRHDLLPRCIRAHGALNTRDEIARALELCARGGFGRLVLVSSPTHAPRCARDASALLAARPELRDVGLLVFVCASHTSFTKDEGADAVAILEPPHRSSRGDADPRDVAPGAGEVPETAGTDAELALHRLVARSLRLEPRARRELCARLAQLLERLETEVSAIIY